AAAEGADRPPGLLPAGALTRLGWSPLRIGNSAFTLSPDGKAVVAVAPEGIVRRFDAAPGRLLEQRQLTPPPDVWPVGQDAAQVSAGGWVAALSESAAGVRRITVWDVPAGKVLFRRTPAKDDSLGCFALSPDGQRLAVSEHVGRRTLLRAYDVTT